jgi:hypothetical protein
MVEHQRRGRDVLEKEVLERARELPEKIHGWRRRWKLVSSPARQFIKIWE